MRALLIAKNTPNARAGQIRGIFRNQPPDFVATRPDSLEIRPDQKKTDFDLLSS